MKESTPDKTVPASRAVAGTTGNGVSYRAVIPGVKQTGINDESAEEVLPLSNPLQKKAVPAADANDARHITAFRPAALKESNTDLPSYEAWEVIQQKQRYKASASSPVVQRVISDKAPITVPDIEWTTVEANMYIRNKGLTDSAWPENAEPFTQTDTFVSEIIVAEILEKAKADAVFNADQITDAAKKRLTRTLSVLKNITEEYESVGTNLYGNDDIGGRDEIVAAWQKLILDRTAVLAENNAGDAVKEIKAMIRFAQNFSIEKNKLETIQQMSFLLKDHPGKQAFYPDFAYVLGSSFQQEPGADVLSHKVNAMINIRSHGIAPEAESDQHYLLRLMVALAPILGNADLANLDVITAPIRVTIMKVQKELLSKGITTGNIDEIITDGDLNNYKPLIRNILAVDIESYMVRTRLEESRVDIGDMKLLASHAGASDISGVNGVRDISKEQLADIKAKSSREGISASIAAGLAEKEKGKYRTAFALILNDTPLNPETYSKIIEEDYEMKGVFNFIHFYITEKIFPNDEASVDFSALKQMLLEKKDVDKQPMGADIEKHIKSNESRFDPTDDIKKFNKLISKIQMMDLDPEKVTAFKPAMRSEASTPLAFVPSLMQDIGKAATGADLSEGYLHAILAAEGQEKINKLVLFIRFAPKEDLINEMKRIMAEQPGILPALNNKLFKLTAVDLNASGVMDTLSGITGRALLDATTMVADTERWSTSSREIAAEARKEHRLEVLPGEVTDLLEKVDINIGVDAFMLGRTVIVPKGGKGIGIKLLKASESEADFNKELAMQKYLAGKKEALGLKSDYPTALGTYTMSETHFDKLSGLIKTGIERAQTAANLAGEPPVKEVVLHAAKKTVMLYEAPWTYFIYENRTGLTTMPDLPDIDEAIKTGREHFFEDAMKLLKEGVGFPQLIDLNHNSDRIYNWMIDIIRTYGGNLQGMGRIDNWKAAARYPNIRASGLADVGDSVTLSDMTYEQRLEYQTNEAESAQGKVWTTMEAQKHKMLIAQYFGSYLLSSVLAEAHGFFVAEQNTMTGSHPKSIEEIVAAKGMLITRLTHVFQAGFNKFRSTFKADATDIATHIITEADIVQLADEMIFFMGGQYMETLKAAALEGGLETYTPKEEPGKEYEARLQLLFGEGVKVAPLNQLPEQHGVDAVHRQALGLHGTFVSTVEEGEVTADTNRAESEKGHDREVDLGFVNGPMPIAKLQELIYKMVTLGVVAVS